jgi:hypothetical protein
VCTLLLGGCFLGFVLGLGCGFGFVWLLLWLWMRFFNMDFSVNNEERPKNSTITL